MEHLRKSKEENELKLSYLKWRVNYLNRWLEVISLAFVLCFINSKALFLLLNSTTTLLLFVPPSSLLRLILYRLLAHLRQASHLLRLCFELMISSTKMATLFSTLPFVSLISHKQGQFKIKCLTICCRKKEQIPIFPIERAIQRYTSQQGMARSIHSDFYSSTKQLQRRRVSSV